LQQWSREAVLVLCRGSGEDPEVAADVKVLVEWRRAWGQPIPPTLWRVYSQILGDAGPRVLSSVEPKRFERPPSRTEAELFGWHNEGGLRKIIDDLSLDKRRDICALGELIVAAARAGIVHEDQDDVALEIARAMIRLYGKPLRKPLCEFVRAVTGRGITLSKARWLVARAVR
jgi:hypothetical protein